MGIESRLSKSEETIAATRVNYHPTPEYELARNAINSTEPLAGNRLVA